MFYNQLKGNDWSWDKKYVLLLVNVSDFFFIILPKRLYLEINVPKLLGYYYIYIEL